MEQGGARCNFKAVVQKTGLKPDTLRGWERRYGLSTPERSRGGHHLYPQHDIDTIQTVGEQQTELGQPIVTWFGKLLKGYRLT